MIFATENSNKSQKTRFWKEKSVEDVVTLGSTAQTTLVWHERGLLDVDKNMTNVLKHMKPSRTICNEPLAHVPNKAAAVGLSKHIMFVTTPDMAGCNEINCGRHYSEFLQNKWTHNSTSSLSNSIPNLCFMYMFCSSYESDWCWGFIPDFFRHFLIGGGGLHGDSFWNQGSSHKAGRLRDTVNQHTPPHHPVDACYYSVVDEPQLS